MNIYGILTFSIYYSFCFPFRCHACRFNWKPGCWFSQIIVILFMPIINGIFSVLVRTTERERFERRMHWREIRSKGEFCATQYSRCLRYIWFMITIAVITKCVYICILWNVHHYMHRTYSSNFTVNPCSTRAKFSGKLSRRCVNNTPFNISSASIPILPTTICARMTKCNNLQI